LLIFKKLIIRIILIFATPTDNTLRRGMWLSVLLQCVRITQCLRDCHLCSCCKMAWCISQMGCRAEIVNVNFWL